LDFSLFPIAIRNSIHQQEVWPSLAPTIIEDYVIPGNSYRLSGSCFDSDRKLGLLENIRKSARAKNVGEFQSD
jgi:hypothetical protein